MGVPYAEVIGDPIAHSKSPAIHKFWLERLGLEGDYRRVQVKPEELESYFASRRQDPDWRGCNITAPHKERALALMDRVDRQVRRIRAINCAVPDQGGLGGVNSDVDGLNFALRGVVRPDSRVIMLGAGGAARAALSYLASRGARTTILARDPGKAEVLRTVLPRLKRRLVAFEPWDALADHVADAQILINSTPLGSSGGQEMPEHILKAIRPGTEADTAFDMVYSPLRTPFLVEAEQKGWRTVSGLDMLIGQALVAFTLFFGVAPPPDSYDGLWDLLTR